MQKYIATAIKKDVNNPEPKGETPAINVDVFVRLLNDSLATIYSDNGVTTITQPLKTDNKGRVEFYAANDRYKIIYDLPSGQVSDVDIILEDPEDRKATQQQAIDGADDSQFMTPLRTHQSFNQYGLGNYAPISDFWQGEGGVITTEGLQFFGTQGSFNSSISNNCYRNSSGQITFTNKNALTQGEGAILEFSALGLDYRTGSASGITLSDITLTCKRDGTFKYNGFDIFHKDNIKSIQNASGGTVSNNATVSGSSLNPPQSGTWRNVSGNDVENNDYGLFMRD